MMVTRPQLHDFRLQDMHPAEASALHKALQSQPERMHLAEA